MLFNLFLRNIHCITYLSQKLLITQWISIQMPFNIRKENRIFAVKFVILPFNCSNFSFTNISKKIWHFCVFSWSSHNLHCYIFLICMNVGAEMGFCKGGGGPFPLFVVFKNSTDPLIRYKGGGAYFLICLLICINIQYRFNILFAKHLETFFTAKISEKLMFLITFFKTIICSIYFPWTRCFPRKLDTGAYSGNSSGEGYRILEVFLPFLDLFHII